jgi:hypothetical protein
MGYSRANLEGTWQGVYVNNAEPTRFTAAFRSAGGRFSGSIVEPNGISRAPFYLYSDVVGRFEIDGRTVSFVKTYNGVGGLSHSVLYQGVVSDDGRQIAGTWSIGAVSGPFEMAR